MSAPQTAPLQAPADASSNPNSGTPNPNNGTESEHAERPAGKYWVACEQAPEGLAYCHIYRNGLLIAQGRGRDTRAAWLEAHRNVRFTGRGL
jgi:hypothetical protein